MRATRTSTSSASTRFARCRSTRSRRRTRAIRGRRWRWRRSPTRSGSASCASTPPTRSGPVATASCSPPGTPRCCSTRCSTWPACRRSTPTTRCVGKPAVSLDDIESFRQLDSRAPGHPEYRWTSGRRDHHRPARPGRRDLGRDGDRLEVAGGALQPARLELFDFDVYAICGDGCLMEGISNEAASLAGHLQLDNLCWIYDNNHITIDGNTQLAYGDDVAARFMGYGWNVTTGRRRQRPRADRPRLRGVQGRGGPADADHRRQPHRLRLAAQAGHRRRPRRAARRGGGARDQARLRLARGRPVPRPRRGQRALRRGDRRARRRAARQAGSRRSPPTPGGARARRRDRRDAAARAARGLGRGDPHLRRRREGDRHPQGLQQGRERDRRRACPGCSPAPPTSPTRPRSASTFDGAVDFEPGSLRRPPAPLRHPRARVGGGLQRPLAVQAAPALVDLPHLLRLRPPGDPALGADGAAGRSTSSPTTRSASARTARPTSRSSSSPRCARSPAST